MRRGVVSKLESTTKRSQRDWVVFSITAAFSIAFVVWGFVDKDSLSTISANAKNGVITNLGWLFVIASTGFVIFVIWLAMSRFGRIPLGGDDDQPEFRTSSWIAMMFSAGMGIGLMFFGVAEPLTYYVSPPPGTVDPETVEAFKTAMGTTMFHWGLHPWAIYAVVGLAIGYGMYRKGRSQLLSAAFTSLFGDRANGIGGKIIDILAIFATLFGSAASLGLGALQIGDGLKFAGWVGTVGTPILVIIIAVLTFCFILSAVSGVARGIQWLSNINMVLALALAVFVFVAGPTLLILNLLPSALGDYAQDFVQMSTRTNADGDAQLAEWLSSWTIFYWAWWISWTPFVGLFIARISRGRTIRQFVSGVLFVPMLVSLVWFAIFGGAAINRQHEVGDLASDGKVDSTGALFSLLDTMPWAGITTVVVMMLVAIFFVSGADAASIVMGSLSERGVHEPQKSTVIFWGALTGAVAAIMLVVGDGGATALTGLQNITIVASVPFVIVMIVLCVALYKDLSSDRIVAVSDRSTLLVERAVAIGEDSYGDNFDLVTRYSETGTDPVKHMEGVDTETDVENDADHADDSSVKPDPST
ncbi:choline/carnitine/betaine transport [Gordonia malaquae]|uniref:Glycine betaine transporter n=1 Tax=Gordonia malaquae NBRC 108250 TaxID=1223542 RepID=M3TAN5_GORML|nr:glycine betaine transporter [Gordonia malaquae NBRC 108250]SED41082.1 choline/carnitine/betaine transport [Gordonia malaquae]